MHTQEKGEWGLEGGVEEGGDRENSDDIDHMQHIEEIVCPSPKLWIDR